ncbi:MAG TPA: OmpA family protein [Kofleriaceae bacterium]|nr:OmpA family protein [Kofleriaceae bacterium]
MNRLLRPTLVAAWTAGALASLTSSANAQVEIGGTAGIHLFSHDNELGVADVPNANSERNSALFGLRLGVFFTPMFGVEGEFGVIPSEARQTTFDVWNIAYRAQFVAQFRAENPDVKLIPFVLVGGGAMTIVDNGGSKNDAQIAKDTDAELFVGAGLKYRVDNGWGLRLDLRLLFPPSSKDSSFTEDFEGLLSIYKELGRQPPKPPPPPVDDDPDHDGIRGAADKCPNEPEDKDGFQDEDGCPDPDNDNDGVPDAQDKCPLEPETKNGYQDEDGCPDELPAKLKQFTGVIQGINFKLGDATLQASSNGTLDKAVAVLKEFGDLKLEIQGHTDDQPLKPGGKYADNQALSQSRADTVKAYLVGKGIEESRLTSKGFGDTIPVESPKDLTGGKLNAARAKNRRVEFKLVSALTQ